MKNFRKIFCLKFGMTKKVDALTHPQWRKIQSPEGSVKEIILKKKIDLKFGMNKKSWCPGWCLDTHSHLTNSESRALGKGKNSENFTPHI